MGLELVEINHLHKKELKQFIQFPFDLYKDHPYWVPPLWADEYDMFSPVHNPVLQHCQLKLFVLIENNVVKGRVAGIINHRENKLYGKSKARFGWYDVVDDPAVTELLLEVIETWARQSQICYASGIHRLYQSSRLDRARTRVSDSLVRKVYQIQ